MPRVLLLGNGFVSGPCLEYLLKKGHHVTVASRKKEHAERFIQPGVAAISLDVQSHEALVKAISEHDIVISLIPYTLHARVIRAAIAAKRNVVTTSYVSPEMQSLDAAYCC
jgi:saccharopine dehydrogenase (NADP+, L-glutamate forming)